VQHSGISATFGQATKRRFIDAAVVVEKKQIIGQLAKEWSARAFSD
jgi:hypothetical protein